MSSLVALTLDTVSAGQFRAGIDRALTEALAWCLAHPGGGKYGLTFTLDLQCVTDDQVTMVNAEHGVRSKVPGLKGLKTQALVENGKVLVSKFDMDARQMAIEDELAKRRKEASDAVGSH